MDVQVYGGTLGPPPGRSSAYHTRQVTPIATTTNRIELPSQSSPGGFSSLPFAEPSSTGRNMAAAAAAAGARGANGGFLRRLDPQATDIAHKVTVPHAVNAARFSTSDAPLARMRKAGLAHTIRSATAPPPPLPPERTPQEVVRTAGSPRPAPYIRHMHVYIHHSPSLGWVGGWETETTHASRPHTHLVCALLLAAPALTPGCARWVDPPDPTPRHARATLSKQVL
jgi:hypothetical protein